jgi:AcrR family transcriptional regulator
MRQRIIAVAGRLFAERGYESTSVRDIAEQLGISNPSLYHHFASKADLLDELLRQPLDRVAQAAATAAGLEGRDRFRVLIEGMLEALEVHGGVAVTVLDPRSGIVGARRALAEAAVPDVVALLTEAGDAGDVESRQIRVMMAVAAVEAAVRHLMAAQAGSDDFVTRLRARRSEIVDAALRLLDPPSG